MRYIKTYENYSEVEIYVEFFNPKNYTLHNKSQIQDYKHTILNILGRNYKIENKESLTRNYVWAWMISFYGVSDSISGQHISISSVVNTQFTMDKDKTVSAKEFINIINMNIDNLEVYLNAKKYNL